MSDIFSREKRSLIMAQVKDRETKPEIAVRKFLFSKGFRYRKNYKSLPGTPDIVLPKYRTAIFINGCFWHGHEGCKASALPKSRQEYWIPKIERNKSRDQEKEEQLKFLQWKVIIIWECDIKFFLIENSDLQRKILSSLKPSKADNSG